MDFKSLDEKWNSYWKKNALNNFDRKNSKNKYYVLEMFSYPSASNLHLGHWYNYGPSDSFARFKKMQGYDVFQPMGFDAFGLPAENFAIKTGVHPFDSTMKNIATMETQLETIGAMFDPNSMLYTCAEDYYRWTQWLFCQLYKHGLAYQKLAPVNFCPSCNTVIANEQVIDNSCERCGTEVLRKELTQWFFKITDYADELLEGLEKLDWPEKTKLMQKNWIGKSEGAEIDFALPSGENIKVFTTRADTLMGVTYVVLAPEHKLVEKITTKDCMASVLEYKAQTEKSSDIERLSTLKEKTGVFTGAYCIHPITKQEVPVFIADYCLVTYGTGAVMAVPAHDERDFEFAKKYDLPIKRVIDDPRTADSILPYTEYGVLVDSGEFSGMTSADARIKIAEFLESKNLGARKINYRLRDWSVSRQRYWGAPIPVIYCDKCGTHIVPEKDLPVKLPYNVNFTPDGVSPLKKSEEFCNTVCPSCGSKAKRESDTLDTFVCSSWYFLRYPDSKNSASAFDPDLINSLLPVDKYIGGAEHACMHLLYARFITKALRDMGYLKFDEPFTSLVHQGTILGTDGFKMSKSKGNVVNPDIYTSEYGSDVFRLYLMFGFSYIEGGPWNDDGIKAVARFLERAVRIVLKINDYSPSSSAYGACEKELDFVLHNTIKNVTQDLEVFSFNTAIARIMELVNAMYKYDTEENKNTLVLKNAAKNLVLLLAPFVPHIAEELNELTGGKKSVFESRYPTFDSQKLLKDEIEIALQVNSKLKSRIVIPASATEDEVMVLALTDKKIAEAIGKTEIKKFIYIKGRIANFIV